ncbi:hypothetical protein AQ490_27110 [Wenjunlia vitaminophila]|uniref:Uncharacterized protein n=1 Tax=Wenjunlia vitaminophila TaxID=76728 RepID=A0A0T6LPU8_WENVI|nr:hypothetical protein AQ490_27110 [Wenjunlia vitaminophila]
MIIKKLHEMGVRSDYAYAAGVGSIGLALLSWFGSLKVEEGQDLARADRWGIFIGEWAPTFLTLGLALQHYEDNGGCCH